MREATFLILTALADEARHGYGIIQEVNRMSGGRRWWWPWWVTRR